MLFVLRLISKGNRTEGLIGNVFRDAPNSCGVILENKAIFVTRIVYFEAHFEEVVYNLSCLASISYNFDKQIFSLFFL